MGVHYFLFFFLRCIILDGMKKVLIIDTHTLFKDFLKQKLSLDQIEVTVSQQKRDGYTKLISTLPNLVILDMNEDKEIEMDFLEKKAGDINTLNIPVIITGPATDKKNIASLAKYGVIKYFTKPIQFDIFFEAVSNVLKIPLTLDTTPSVLDVHHNGNIIFVEFAYGLNREKLALLQYKLTNMIEHEHIESPKIIIMFTGLKLTFVDGYNLEFLLDNVLACPKVHTKNVKILSNNDFIAELIEGHPNYSGIEVSDNLAKITNALIDTSYASSVSEVITDRIITSSAVSDAETSSIETRFHADTGETIPLGTDKDGTVLNVAIIDSDTQNLMLTRTVFETIGANCTQFTTGEDFLNTYVPGMFNLIILDVLLSDQKGFAILERLHLEEDAPPVIVYSQTLQKDIVVKVLSLGAKSYLVKPQKPNLLLHKCLSYISGSF